MEIGKFAHVLDGVIQSSSVLAALRAIENFYDHDFSTYHLLMSPHVEQDKPYVFTTYPDNWITHYLLNSYSLADPVIERGLSECKSFGWHELQFDSEAVGLSRVAAEFGIGQSGYSFAFEDGRGRRSLFSLNARMETSIWKRYLEPLIREFETLLPILHSKAVAEATAENHGAPQLTRREHECLRLSADGKSYSEIAIILSLSDHTVRSYLKLARIKLDCITLAQAVAKAVRLRII